VSYAIQQEVNVVPKCPECGNEMTLKKTKKGEQLYVCEQHGAFIPKSIFGVT
jgi:ssDNA-binding Zn-finger/Zn-ribbon topoisomerase 1